MKNRTTYIDANLLVSSSESDEKVRVFQRKLYIAAKRDKRFIAHSLYDKICIDYVLVTAFYRVKQNYSKGVGVDGESIANIEQSGLLNYLSQLQEELREKRYQSNAVKRVLIPKEEKGTFRKLGIPTVKDRIVQMAVKMVIEPLWEAEFIDTSYGFRPKRSAKDAIKQVKANIYESYQFVYDADLSKYFDTIPHDRLFICLKRKIADSSILHLIHQWLKSPIRLETGALIKSKEGCPQGGVISPLLSNIYLHEFDKIVSNPKGKFAKARIRIVRYADDFLLMGKWYFSKEILSYLSRILDNMGLSLNRKKSKLLHSSKSSLYFLGFEFHVIRSKFEWNKKNYTNIRPSMKSRSKLFSKLRELLSKRGHWTIEWIVWKLNKVLLGWLNYFSISKTTHIWETVKVIKKQLDYKLFKWMKSKGRKAHRTLRQRPYDSLVKLYKLIDIEKYARLKTLSKAQ
jgi:RNA-directed DNA polymerase